MYPIGAGEPRKGKTHRTTGDGAGTTVSVTIGGAGEEAPFVWSEGGGAGEAVESSWSMLRRRRLQRDMQEAVQSRPGDRQTEVGRWTDQGWVTDRPRSGDRQTEVG
jgi:hypothetical protein